MSGEFAPPPPGFHPIRLDPLPPPLVAPGGVAAGGPAVSLLPPTIPLQLPEVVLANLLKDRVPVQHLNMVELYMGLDCDSDGQFRPVASSLKQFVELMKRLQRNGHLTDVEVPLTETVRARMGKVGDLMLRYLPAENWVGVRSGRFLAPIPDVYPVRCGWTDLAVAARPLLGRILVAMGVQRWVTLLPPVGPAAEAV